MTQGPTPETMTIDEFDVLMRRFYADSPPRNMCKLPYPRIDRPIIRQVSTNDGDFMLTEYAPSGGACRLGRHRLEGVMEHWVGFRFAQRMQCACGSHTRIDVY